jgi:hypothetical protein
MPLRAAIPREIIDPEANLSARQRANRVYYLRNVDLKRAAARVYYWDDAEHHKAIRRERYQRNGR